MRSPRSPQVLPPGPPPPLPHLWRYPVHVPLSPPPRGMTPLSQVESQLLKNSPAMMSPPRGSPMMSSRPLSGMLLQNKIDVVVEDEVLIISFSCFFFSFWNRKNVAMLSSCCTKAMEPLSRQKWGLSAFPTQNNPTFLAWPDDLPFKVNRQAGLFWVDSPRNWSSNIPLQTHAFWSGN